jgi:hypothetical protein
MFRVSFGYVPQINSLILNHYVYGMPVSFAARSFAEIVASNSAVLPRAWKSVRCQCCVLSGRGPCDELNHSSKGVLPVVLSECDCEASIMRRPWPTGVVAP